MPEWQRETFKVTFPEPSKIAKITPIISGFCAVKDREYIIPFKAENLTLSNLTIKANTKYFSTLEVIRLNDTTGEIKIVTNLSITDLNRQSIITITDEISQITTSLVVIHVLATSSVTLKNINNEGNIINSIWSINEDGRVAITPKISIVPALKHHIIYNSDYFNQLYLYKGYSRTINQQIRIVLEEFYSGELTIIFEDTLLGIGISKIINVDYF